MWYETQRVMNVDKNRMGSQNYTRKIRNNFIRFMFDFIHIMEIEKYAQYNPAKI